MRASVAARREAVNLDKIVRRYDNATREDGFTLHGWDGIADKVNVDTIPVGVLNYRLNTAERNETDAASPPYCSITTSAPARHAHARSGRGRRGCEPRSGG